ncbi:MAG: threonylcarbamoyl-AMP synthase [Candidatus Solibacter usitatus]|nr:threonylcarbamoyl-AMP synthase [Candidatus Solibacter usitatus]
MTSPNKAAIAEAARLIRAGSLVAFPTETVYGLGANALDAAAVARIFAAKGRPASSPLIVHVASLEAARALAAEWPDAAELLARKFWPGPLTLVLAKKPVIPYIVTADLATVGLRVPANPWALALLKQAQVPIAAPSANRFMHLSPTTAAHVRASLGDSVDYILDGGATQVGIESTVVSLAGSRPLLLRPGMISAAAIEQVIGKIEAAQPLTSADAHPSPGMHARHYSPQTPLVFQIPSQGRGAYLWITRPLEGAHNIKMPADAAGYAAVLYETLHKLDSEKLDWIAVERPPDSPEWAGILDRLTRASGAGPRPAVS